VQQSDIYSIAALKHIVPFDGYIRCYTGEDRVPVPSLISAVPGSSCANKYDPALPMKMPIWKMYLICRRIQKSECNVYHVNPKSWRQPTAVNERTDRISRHTRESLKRNTPLYQQPTHINSSRITRIVIQNGTHQRLKEAEGENMHLAHLVCACAIPLPWTIRENPITNTKPNSRM
jgi:hypothetical protein